MSVQLEALDILGDLLSRFGGKYFLNAHDITFVCFQVFFDTAAKCDYKFT